MNYEPCKMVGNSDYSVYIYIYVYIYVTVLLLMQVTQVFLTLY